MKKILISFLLLISIITISGCKQEEITYLLNPIAIVYKNNIPYILDKDNSLFSLSEYDAIVPYFDDIIIVKKNNLFGYIKNTGEPITEIIYKESYQFSENKAVVSLNENFYIINENGDIIYSFDNGISSISSFSENLLVITKNSKQGYLEFNQESSTFELLVKEPINEETTLLDSNLIYDYCGQFLNGYAVVGNLNQSGELKYTHINSKGERLYDLEWDFANNFSEGYAVVANKIDYEVKVYCANQNDFDLNGVTTTAITNGYMYVSPTGEYISHNVVNPETGEEQLMPYVFAMANNIKDGVALVADLYFYSSTYRWDGQYDYSTKDYFYNYDFVNIDGSPLFGENRVTQNNWGGALCSYKDFFKYGDYYISTYYSGYWHIMYTKTDTLNSIFPFSDAFYDTQGYDSEDDLLNDFNWMNDYLRDFTYGNETPIYVVDHIINPYNLTSFSSTKYIENILVAKVQTYSGKKDLCGLITIKLIEDKPVISYVIPPLYDEIIY